MRTPKFLYFDVGNVLLTFSFEKMCHQLDALTPLEVAKVRQIVLGSQLQLRYEAGLISTTEFFATFCRQAEVEIEHAALAEAFNDIFLPNYSIVPVITQLAQAGYPMGLLSNTCDSHWNYIWERYGILSQNFSILALSHELGVCKPEAEIYHKAAKLAGCRPDEIFYADDIALNVEGAKQVGFDAVLYTTTPQLVSDLRCRGLRFNY